MSNDEYWCYQWLMNILNLLTVHPNNKISLKATILVEWAKGTHTQKDLAASLEVEERYIRSLRDAINDWLRKSANEREELEDFLRDKRKGPQKKDVNKHSRWEKQGKLLSKARTDRNLTQQDVIESKYNTCLNRNKLSKIECGLRQPTTEELWTMCVIYALSVKRCLELQIEYELVPEMAQEDLHRCIRVLDI